MLLTLIYTLITSVTSQVQIYAPNELKQEFNNRYHNGEIPSSLGNFGNPPYGTILIGKVYTPNRQEEFKACRPLSAISMKADDLSFFLMIERGDCYFVQKVRFAQEIGAAAVLIVDNVEEDATSIIMIDNGTGGNLFIPSFLISKADGDYIWNYISNEPDSEDVTISLTFAIKTNKTKIEFGVWFIPDDLNVLGFLEQFESFGSNFDIDLVEFEPHYFSYPCHTCMSRDFTVRDPNCISGGRYCAGDPDGQGSISGQDIILEGIREKCIYKQGLLQKSYRPWFQYMSLLKQKCGVQHMTQACSQEIMKQIGVNPQTIEECVQASAYNGDIELDENAIMSQEEYYRSVVGVYYYPAITVNNQTYRGDLEVEAVFTAICAGYGNAPEMCMEVEPIEIVDSDDEDGISINTVIYICAGLIILAIVLLVAYRFYARHEFQKDLNQHVSVTVSKYVALHNQSGSP